MTPWPLIQTVFLAEIEAVKIWLARELASEIRQILAEMKLKKSNWTENPDFKSENNQFEDWITAKGFLVTFWLSKSDQGKNLGVRLKSRMMFGLSRSRNSITAPFLDICNVEVFLQDLQSDNSATSFFRRLECSHLMLQVSFASVSVLTDYKLRSLDPIPDL